MKKEYGFDKQNELGKIGERMMTMWFAENGYTVDNITLSQNKTGFDMYITDQSGVRSKVEVKTDFQTMTTKNVFIETASQIYDDHMVDGWALTSTSKYLAYLTMSSAAAPSGYCIFTEMDKAKNLVPVLKAERCRTGTAKNRTYSSSGYLMNGRRFMAETGASGFFVANKPDSD